MRLVVARRIGHGAAEAANLYGQLLKEDSGNVAALAGLARCYVATGNLEQAKKTLALVPEAKLSDTAVAAARAAYPAWRAVRLTPIEALRMYRRLRKASPGSPIELILKRGDRYLRMLLTHGARSVLRAASVAVRAGKTVDGLRQWALGVQHRANHNKAACALANKLARICYATLRDGEPYGAARLHKKLTRTAFALPA